MRLREVWIRFYKSFNYDYELQANPAATKKAWQSTRDGWMPHVRVPLEGDITAVVGANESGKTHLLDAIKIVLTGENHRQRDFCRSSTLFSVERDSRLFPEVGATLVIEGEESSAVDDAAIPRLSNGDILMLRPEPGAIDVVSAEDERVQLSERQVGAIEAILPSHYELHTEVALPDSVSISVLANMGTAWASRRKRFDLLNLLDGIGTAEQVAERAPSLLALIEAGGVDTAAAERLGIELLTRVARIDETSFKELRSAIQDEREGLVNGLIQEMNNSIARHLNVSRWWSQDPDFQLRVSPREHELVFTIRDRTGTDYSFTERSKGLRYFLSYYVQLLAHDRPQGRSEVLLMDEPDAYLSASGQQDLLRVLEHYARPDDSERNDQVVYVTHSPFLINRNAGHRVRVVDKGVRDEGTRLVKDATRNHYEPLRTSLGAFVAETAFIGGDNLFVEGIADQVLLAGMNARLLRTGAAPSACLDLNAVTIVPGGSNIAYMLYLARGRDQIKPACAVLLDGDDAGQEARRQIRRGGSRGRPTVADEFVVLVSDWAEGTELDIDSGVVVEEPEDLVPIAVAVAVARRYAQTFLGVPDEDVRKFSPSAVAGILAKNNGSVWDSLSAAFGAQFGTTISKAGFAKELLAYVNVGEGAPRPTGVPVLDRNFAKLIERLTATLQAAREAENDERRDQRLERIVETFVSSFPNGSTRDGASTVLKRVDSAVDGTVAGDVIQAATARLRREFKLTAEPLRNIDQYVDFLDRLKNLKHLVRLQDQGVIDLSGK